MQFVKDDMAGKKTDSSKQRPPKPAINEADFQASIITRLREALPLLPSDIRAERYLHLKLGHHEVTVNGLSEQKKGLKGRSDVVVFRDDKPLLLAELKAPNVPITDEDVAQGLSYARLHQPMVPLVLVTNGDQESTRLVLTYDGSLLSHDRTDSDGLNKILSAASALAASSVDSAIRGLLGSEPAVWKEIINKWNLEEISRRKGALGDFRRAIAENFQIPREAVGVVNGMLNKGAKVVVLHGPPLSGVTCAMAQMVEALTFAGCIYIDSRNAGDILQFIAGRLSRELSIGISRDDVRQWLITGQSLSGLTLLIDSAPSSGLEELLQLAEANSLHLVFGMDSWSFESLRMLPGRAEETTLGRLAEEVVLTELSAGEFEIACKLLFNSSNAVFLPGAELVPDLRSPRHLRIVASQVPPNAPRQIRKTESGDEYITSNALPPIPGVKMLERASMLFGADAKLKHDLSRLASAFLTDVEENGSDKNRMVETYGVPSVDPDILERALGEQRIERLSKQGMIHWSDTRTLGPRLVLRFPELLAHHVSLHWTTALRSADDEMILVVLNRILQHSHIVPYGDLCAAAAIIRIDNDQRLALIFEALTEYLPEESWLREGAVIELLAKDKKGIRLHFGEGMNERIPGDMQPWLVLSHLSAFPADFGDDGASVNMKIFAKLGNHEDLIYRPSPSNFAEFPGLHSHEVPGIGSLLCPSSGIVEPIMQAMYSHASWRPKEFEQLVGYALDEELVFLAWRLKTVASIVKTSTDSQISDVAFRMDQILGEWWNRMINTSIPKEEALPDKS
ncbi:MULTISPECIES: type I restriction enzyme HsdR N-terminal domain-containing protein [Pseudomonas]|uniref:type I restriction enzyme HsdR N-terminal domain-containing protein n=1 Tax=Pseudomonas TaxID=286 RepID=UPI000D009CA3|nr:MULTISPECIES: type I restriction enzyme HsdR N-terminal domain-containing protein [Pseudomonas]PRA52552.1 hypothetical protein CQZ98_16410 [Pseudomonas sp. MYb115]QXN50998.1 type I restriction enzyme HsdR N-terminal domain-containing protein [Pseudomonas fluorescens]WSO25315.1 type I restriction enzyme HsdR N-terminal domain-containing protein [Pseudomonas fluorescens]